MKQLAISFCIILPLACFWVLNAEDAKEGMLSLTLQLLKSDFQLQKFVKPTPQYSVRRGSLDAHPIAIPHAVPRPSARDILSHLSVSKDAVAQETITLIVSFFNMKVV